MTTKRFILLISCLFCFFALHAQSEHLTFMDIPIDGTITEFQTKLREKGIQLDKEESDQLAHGERMLRGLVGGEYCDVSVYYPKSSKKVYRVKVFRVIR